MSGEEPEPAARQRAHILSSSRPEPPPDSDMPTAATAGPTVPSGRVTSVSSIAFQTSPTRARTGRMCRSVSRPLSGVA